MPDPPLNINVTSCRAKQAKVTWFFEEKMSNYQEMEKFVVELLTMFDEISGRWQHAAVVPYVFSSTKNQKTTNYEANVPLSPYAHYKFRVRAVNVMGMSAPSEHTYSWCETPRSVPEKNPQNVRTDEQYTGYLVIKWDVSI